MNSDRKEHTVSENLPHINSSTDGTETRKYCDTHFRTNSTRKKLTTSASVSSALLKTRETVISTTDLSELTENIRKIRDELTLIRLSIETLTEMKNDQQKSINLKVQSLKPVLKKVKFIETPFTIEDPLKFRLECKGRMYEAIYDARCQRTLVGPAYVDENKIRKLTVRERVKIYVPGKTEPLLAISEVADATFKLSTTTFTIEAAVHRERNTPIILGKDFGQHFIIGVNMEHKILTLKDDTAVPIAINFEPYT